MLIPGILVLLGLLVACMPTYSTSPAVEGGVEGYVMMGATCGAVSQLQDTERCRNKPLQMQLEVTDSEGRAIVTMHSDQNGYYRIVLTPGNYILKPQKHAFLDVQSRPFEVSDKGFVHINVLYVTGIK